jgi:hypothetical protein
MLNKPRSYFLLLGVILLASCTPHVVATPQHIGTPSFIPVSPTLTITPTETEMSTPTQPATLTPLQANEKIRTLLQEPIDCSAPCFWGITPQQTTFAEATNIFASLGLQPIHTLTQNSQEFYDTDYQTEEGLEVSIILTVQDDIVKTLDAGMNVPREVTIPRKWSAYSPETLVKRYGTPSRVEFSLTDIYPNNGANGSMMMYFDNVDMIVLYNGTEENFLKDQKSFNLCPLNNGIDFVKIWMGEELRHPPLSLVPLEQATSLTLDDFSKLMLGDPNKACFNLKDEPFH